MQTNDSPKSTAHEQHRTRIDGYSPYPRSGSSWTAREKKKKTEQASRDAVYTPRTISSLTELETTTKQTNKKHKTRSMEMIHAPRSVRSWGAREAHIVQVSEHEFEVLIKHADHALIVLL